MMVLRDAEKLVREEAKSWLWQLKLEMLPPGNSRSWNGW